MIDPSLQNKVIQAATEASHRFNQIDLKSLWELLSDIDPESLLWKRENTKTEYSYGALPVLENPGTALHTMAPAGQVVGIDGSQIYPSALHPVRWAYIQALAYGLSCPVISEAQFLDLEAADPTMADFDESQEDKGSIDFWRTILELKVALRVVKSYPEHIIFMDYPLLPWIPKSDPSHSKRIEQYVDIINQMRGKLIAGIVSEPKSRLLANLIALSEKLSGKQDNITKVSNSLLVCAGLKPGQRSAIFKYAGSRNEVLQKHGIEIYFFFILIQNRDVVRVEIPDWIVHDQPCIDLIHSSILKDSRELGYSYALARAHKEVVISLDIANALHELATGTYIANGGYGYGSAKMRAKG